MDENIKPKDPKKRKMKDDTKIGIAIAASAVLFFGWCLLYTSPSPRDA